jgi:hypothetical protein
VLVRLLPVVLMIGMVTPGRGRARGRAPETDRNGREPTPERQGRRAVDRGRGQPQALVDRSPCGRHLLSVERGVVLIDDRVVREGVSFVLGRPAWHSDGLTAGVAWLERAAGATRLVVLPDVADRSSLMTWAVPGALSLERLHWTGGSSVTVGPTAFHPLAIASWETNLAAGE